MSNSLYEEAIQAAEQIKRAAEDKVKQQLVESMSPKIKLMVERALLDEEELHNKDDGRQDEEQGEKGEESKDECGEGYIEEVVEEEFEQEGFKGTDSTLKDKDLSDGVTMSNESVKIFKKIITKNAQKNAISKKLKQLREGIKSLKKVILLSENNNITRKNSKKIVEAYKNLYVELKNIKTNSIIKSDTNLLREYLEISKELNNMSRRRNTKLNESLDELLEMNLFEDDDDMPEEGAEELDLDDDDMPEMSDDASDDMISKDDLASALEPLMDLAGVEGDKDDDLDLDLGGDEDEDKEDEDEDKEDEDEEMQEEGYFYEMDDMEEAFMEIDEEIEEADMDEMYEDEHMEGMEESSRRGGDLFLEIDENMLKREISKMKRIREGEAKDMASHFGGGSLDKEMFVDVDDSLLNKHDKMKNEAAVRRVVKKNRMLESKLAQHKKAIRKMKGQLSEMNLFNAKLLYANKLMQNRELSLKQQRNIVESLDNAKTLNEAKILFESLSKSLTRSTSRRSSGNLNESTNRKLIGSSSRSTSSAQPINESVALDRWARLAGINK